MKTLKSSPVIIAALCLLLSCSKSDEFAVTDNGANSSSGLIDIGSNLIRLTVTYCRSEDCILEEMINLKDLINSSLDEHICLYSTDGQELTLVPTICDYLGISSTNLIRIVLPAKGIGGTGNETNLINLIVSRQAEYSISEEKINLFDLLKCSQTHHICLYCINGQDLNLMATVCNYLGIYSTDITGIELCTD